jgi:predicted small lipoprotein YifL
VTSARSTESPSTPHLAASAARAAGVLVLALACLAAACGRKGPPLPPLVKVPVPPADLTAARRGDTVDVQFTVPNANTDRSRPANVSRVDVYALTGPPSVAPADVVKHGTKVGSVAVKAPRDPSDTTDPEDAESSEADVEPPEGPGLDQGALARVEERLTPVAREPTRAPRPSAEEAAAADRPLVGPSPATARVRAYVGVGVTTKGRNGPFSGKVTVPLFPAPPPPPTPRVSYSETAITVRWGPATPAAGQSDAHLLPSRPLGLAAPVFGFNVYDAPAGGTPTRLTQTPLAEARFTDPRITWGATRCYVVRSVETIGTLSVESAPTDRACARLVDTFPPAPPTGLNAVATSGEIDLIWDPSTENDLAGYLVVRAPAPAQPGAFVPITPTPISETNFHDQVAPGRRYVYAVEAVDKAGNVSMPSASVEETAR